MGKVIEFLGFREKQVIEYRKEYERLLDLACKFDEEGKTEFRRLTLEKVKAIRQKLTKYTTIPKPYLISQNKVIISERETVDYLELDISIFPQHVSEDF